uniref:Uncharacterized protein n=1 Tax=Megaselia scalaris TaxID=36166 RepID=T1GD00_MEGSC
MGRSSGQRCQRIGNTKLESNSRIMPKDRQHKSKTIILSKALHSREIEYHFGTDHRFSCLEKGNVNTDLGKRQNTLHYSLNQTVGWLWEVFSYTCYRRNVYNRSSLEKTALRNALQCFPISSVGLHSCLSVGLSTRPSVYDNQATIIGNQNNQTVGNN